jgi:hypothetical protein
LTAVDADHSALYRHAPRLDDAAARLGLPPFSSFFDDTELKYNARAEFDPDLAERPADPETGRPYGLDEMRWRGAAEGLAAFNALRDQAGLPGDALAELDDCIAQLHGPAGRGASFHLALIP